MVDDDDGFRTEVASFLASRGFSVYAKGTKESFLFSLDSDRPDIVLLDKEIGDDDGFDLIHAVRHHESLNALPIIIITGHSNLENKRQAILMGADDMMSKPIKLEELELNIISNLRRSKSYHVNDRVLKFQEIEVDIRSHRVTLRGADADLTNTEYKILLELLAKRDTVVNREQLAHRFLSLRNSSSRTLDVHINSLRKKLGDYAGCLKTIRGRGYMFTNDGLA